MPFFRKPADDPDQALPGLMARLLGGDTRALDLIYRQESGAVYRYALALCGNPAWAADAMQDAFVAFAGRPEGWDAARGSLGAYLAGTARYALLARWREARVHVEVPQGDEDEPPAECGAHPSPESLLVCAQDQAQVWAAIHALPWAFREALVLVDLQERPYAEAARIAGVELNTLRTRLHRARSRLAALLNAGQGVAA
ncbi:RNA polymerase sigma factor [Roseateles toxinivorans]|uniref:RNA polymerase sigma-70 factor (ECF subfamily) n=1 Tax=Roseateles toxinivorans TaxID=270368 RepID=A0A4R6QV35_9BURK|nr:RNA polymerase sigma factor [Roseateles toxinivorans]TDP75066.1 RNA polymerase sigma-70 factor (ECF subfamily) [Roseateles toxinivorans]